MRTGPVDVNRPLQSADLKQLQNAKQVCRFYSAGNFLQMNVYTAFVYTGGPQPGVLLSI